MKILYLGSSRGTSLARFEALTSLGCNAELIDPGHAIPRSRVARSWFARTGALGFEPTVRKFVLEHIKSDFYDLVFVDSGELVGPKLIRALRERAARVVNYNPDNPYSGRDGYRWRLFNQALLAYDILFVPRLSNVDDALQQGARSVHRVWFTADDNLRVPWKVFSSALPGRYISDVAFVGTWMPERGEILRRLIDLKVPLTISGPRWDRAPEYRYLKGRINLGYLGTDAYNTAVSAAKISIALLSKGNRDLHTTRSVEIPLLGSVLCAERTSEHTEMYQEGHEAMFWSSADECACICLELLKDKARLQRLADAGRRRAISNNHFNSVVMKEMVEISIRDLNSGAADSTRVCNDQI